MSYRGVDPDRWLDDESRSEPVRALSRDQALALSARLKSPSPWAVIGLQSGLGVLGAALAWLLTDERSVGLSALWGAAVVVLPGALMARGMTSRLSSMSAGASAVSFMLWEILKIAVSVVMLVLAPQIVQPLSWPALLTTLVLCMKMYWLALLWRRP